MTATTLYSLHYTTTTTPLRYNYDYSCSTPHYIQQLWVRWPLQPLQHSNKHNSNHLSVTQWIRSAIRDSQQPTSPIGGFLFWTFRHRLVRYYWCVVHLNSCLVWDVWACFVRFRGKAADTKVGKMFLKRKLRSGSPVTGWFVLGQ